MDAGRRSIAPPAPAGRKTERPTREQNHLASGLRILPLPRWLFLQQLPILHVTLRSKQMYDFLSRIPDYRIIHGQSRFEDTPHTLRLIRRFFSGVSRRSRTLSFMSVFSVSLITNRGLLPYCLLEGSPRRARPVVRLLRVSP